MTDATPDATPDATAPALPTDPALLKLLLDRVPAVWC
jgi:hypothetical protein